MGHVPPTVEHAMQSRAATVVRGLLRWTGSDSAEARTRAARALAQAYLSGGLDPFVRREALLGLTALLDDRSPLVRLALAETLGPSAGAPHALVTALAQDQGRIAAVVVATSPLLTDADLVDAAALGDAAVQIAIARRPALSPAVCAALAEVGTADACAALCGNVTATVTPKALARMLDRHGDLSDLRRAMQERPDLAPEVRHALVVATARSLARFVAERAWLGSEGVSRVVKDAVDQACVTIAADTVRREGPVGTRRLVAHLRQAGRLTPAVLIRWVLRGNLSIFEAAMSELSGVPAARVAGLLRTGRAVGFGALYAKAGLPPALLPVFQAAVFVPGAVDALTDDPALQRLRIARALRACAASDNPHLARVGALLRRLEAEAARDEARTVARATDLLGQAPVMGPASANDPLVLRPAA